MPKTFWTYLIATGALAGIFPLAGLLVEGRDPGRHRLLPRHGGGQRHLPRDDGHADPGRVLHRGLHDPDHLVRLLRRVPRPRHTRTSPGPRITVPLIILATLGAMVGLVNLPKEIIGFIDVPTAVETRFEHFVEPVGLYFPEISHADFNLPLALVSVAAALAGHRHRLRLLLQGRVRGPARPGRAQQGRGLRQEHPGQQVLLRLALHRRHRRLRQGPARPGRQLVQPEPSSTASSTASARAPWAPAAGSTTNIDQKVVDGAVNGVGAAAEGSGGDPAPPADGSHPAVRSAVLRRRCHPGRHFRRGHRLMTSRESHIS